MQTSGTSESTKIQNDSQKFSSEMKTGAAAVTLHTSLPSLIQEPLKAPYQSESEALEEFGTYVFTKLDHYEGHVSRTEMRNMVERGLPFRALKVSLPDSVHVDPNIPSLDRIRGSQVQSETGNASCDSTWIRSPSFDSGQSGSYHLTSPRSRGGRLRLPSLMFDPRIELGSQSSSGGSTSHEKFHDNK